MATPPPGNVYFTNGLEATKSLDGLEFEDIFVFLFPFRGPLSG